MICSASSLSGRPNYKTQTVESALCICGVNQSGIKNICKGKKTIKKQIKKQCSTSIYIAFTLY